MRIQLSAIAYVGGAARYPGDVVAAEDGEATYLIDSGLARIAEPPEPAPPPPAAPAKPAKPEGEALVAAIAAAIGAMLGPDGEPLDAAQFTRGGEPKVEVLAAALGYDIAAADRDAAWAALQQARG